MQDYTRKEGFSPNHMEDKRNERYPRAPVSPVRKWDTLPHLDVAKLEYFAC